MVSLSRVYLFFSLSILMTIIGTLMGLNSIELFYSDNHLTLFYWVIVGLMFVSLLFFIFSPEEIKKFIIWIFTFIVGVTFAPIIFLYYSNGLINIIILALSSSFFLFGLLALLTIKYNIDITDKGTILFVILLVLIVVSFTNILFFKLDWLYFILSIITLFLFSAFVIYDIGRIVNGQVESEMDAVIELYIDFINIFDSILNIFGYLNDD